MKVRTLREHENPHGDKYAKGKGDVYSLNEREGEMLVRRGYVEQVDDENGDAERLSPAGKGTGGAAKGDS